MLLLRSRHFLVVVLFSSIVYGDYDCVCNYNVEKPVLPSADDNATPLGYMYEFDCKPKSTAQAPNGYYTIQFEKQLGYVAIDDQIKIQTCPGSPPIEDLIATTLASTAATESTTSTTLQTTIETTTQPVTTTTTTTPQPTTTTTTTTPQPTTTTTTTTPQPATTTTTTTPQPTTTTTTTTQPTTTTTTTTPVPTTTMTTPIPTTTTPLTSTTTTTKPTTTTTSTQFPATTPKHGWSLAANVSGTPYQYVGVGYNLLTENPETGFHTTHQIFQMTDASNNIHEATYFKHTSCTPHKTTTLLHGSKAYQDELKTLVRPDPSHNDQLLKEAFTYNNQFTQMQQVLDGSITLYLDVVTTCNLGTVRYNTVNASQGNFAVTREFARDVCALPTNMTPLSTTKYMQFLDKWGTSIVTSVDLGRKQLERYTTNAAAVFQHVQETDTQLLELRGPFEGFSSSVVINTHDFGNSPASQTPFGTLSKTTTFGTTPETPVGGDVIPIAEALNKMYWSTILDQAVAEKICPDSIYGTDLDRYQTSLQVALSQYAGYKGNIHPHHDLLDHHTLQVPITWPYGTYGLMKATSGCPLNNVQWQDGWRKQDTEDSSSHNEFSPNIANYMSGDFHTDDMTTRFCMKTSEHSSSGGQYDQQWPKGSYCILKKNACPTGFTAGYIYWDDEDDIFGNNNARGGTLPDGTYDDDTKVNYCCRNDGSTSNKILLPTDRPFLLIRYGSICQSVYGMSVDELFIRWDDEDSENKDTAGGMHPMDDGGSSDHKLHFCFYSTPGGPAIIG